MNALSPNQMTRPERLDEVARFLAQGILRRRARMINDRKSVAVGLDGGHGIDPHVPGVGAN